MKLFAQEEPAPEVRPMLLSMAALMLLLLPILMLVLNPEKTTALPLAMAGSAQDLPPPPPGIVESLVIKEQKKPNLFILTAKVRRSDVRSSAGDVELKEWSYDDFLLLQKQLRVLKTLDPSRARIELAPAPNTSTEQVIRWMDLLRKDNEGVLFEEILLHSSASRKP